MSPSPGPSRPCASTVSKPCARKRSDNVAAWIDGPPMFSRVMSRTTRVATRALRLSQSEASRPRLSRRKLIVFATITALLPIVLMTAVFLGLDLYLHKRAEKSAGLNRWGYRGPVVGRKQPGETRIVVLGGSTAFGYGVTWSEAAPAVLERQLNTRHPDHPVSVVNLGFNNEGAYAYRPTLEDFRFLNYDVAVLFDG